MAVFVDTSALYALLDEDDPDHRPAAAAFPQLAANGPLLTHNYVVAEAAAVVHRRLGASATRDLLESLVPSLDVVWIDQRVHELAVAAFLAALRRGASLVDWVSFEVMRRHGIDRAFAFDRDFAAQGFEVVPNPRGRAEPSPEGF